MIETKFKNTEVGLIPEDWEVEPIKRLCKVNGRIGFRGYNKFDLVPFGMGAYTIGGKHITHNELDLSDPDFISWEKYYESPEIMVEKGDIVMAQRGTLGRAAYIKENVGPATINPSLVLLNHIKVDAQYLHYIIVSDKITDVLINSGSQTSVPMISQAQIESTLIPIPIPIEQSRIATALSDIDDLISITKKLIEKKRNIKEGAMQELLSGKRRLPEFKEKWVETTVGSVTSKICRGQTLTSDEFSFGIIPVMAGGKQYAGFHNKANQKGRSITISGSGASAGFVYLHNAPIFATDCSVISESNSFSLDFMYYLLTYRQEDLYKLQTGGAQPHVYPRDIESIEISTPTTKDEQQAIAIVLSDMDSEIQLLEARLTKYQSLKQGMMQQLLTGKIRLI